MEKKIKVVSAVLIAVVVVAFAVAGTGSFIAQMHQNLLRKPPAAVELSGLGDGTYTGRCTAFPVSAEVRVTVKNHQITGIEVVKHNHGRGKPAEAVTGAVIELQSLQVDAISGATLSSKVILKAIENALIKAY